MLDLYKASLVLNFLKTDSKGKEVAARVTLANVRKDLSVDEMKQLVKAFEALISHQLVSAELVEHKNIL